MDDSQSGSTLDVRGLPRAFGYLRPLIHQVARDILKEHKIDSFAISITFVKDSQISKLNKAALGRDGPTDVIAFDLSERGLRFDKVGDVYISSERAVENSLRFGVSCDEEFLRLVIHGILHVLGYTDDSTSRRRKMHRTQEMFLKRYLGSLTSRRNQ